MKRSQNAFRFLMLQGEGRTWLRKQETSFTQTCTGPLLGADPPALLIAQGGCLDLAVLSYRPDSAQGLPVRHEKAVTDATLLRCDERYESEEVGGKLALGLGTQCASSWMGLKEEEGDPKGKNITVSSCLLSKPLR